MNASRIVAVTLDERTILRRSPEVEQERAVAIADLLEENRFEVPGIAGPYTLHLSAAENRLSVNITGAEKETAFLLPLAPLRGTIKDYFMICESYFDAIRQASPSRIETIDMARRGIHNDAADTLTDMLDGKATLNHATARRLFTLICVLHVR